MSAVSVRDLRKSYGDFEAVRGISFDVPEGSFFAFLGPNGAGKSTTISILCSLLSHDSGTVEVFGKEPSQARTEIGVVFQDHMLDDKLTVRENISLRGSMYGLKGQGLKDAVDKVIVQNVAQLLKTTASPKHPQSWTGFSIAIQSVSGVMNSISNAATKAF